MTEWLIQDAREAARVNHPSTAAALEAMREWPSPAPNRILDLGCGSGLLTLAAAELWPSTQLSAGDISAQAVADASANFTRAGIAQRVLLRRSDGLSDPDLRAGGPYDLVLANLLAELLVREARAIHDAIAPGGRAVLSGILAWRRENVTLTYTALGFEMEQEIVIDSWHALVARKAGSPHP